MQMLQRLLGDPESLRRRTISGSRWLFLKSAVQGLVDLAKTAVFVRVLQPHDYGVMELAMMAVGLLEAFSTLGLDIMIQREGDDYQNRLKPYWTIKLVRGVALASLAWVAAIPLAAFYERAELVPLVRLMALSFLFNGLAGFGREIRQRQMAFGAVALVESLRSLLVFLIGLGLLFWLRDVWALAAYTVLTAFSLMVTSYILHPWRPGFRLDRSILRGVAAFSGSIVAINALNYLFNNFDRGLIGKLMSTEQLGYYGRGYFLALVPVVYLFNVISPVYLPAFRQVADDPAKWRRAFGKTFLAVSGLAAGIGALCFLFSKLIVLTIYGEKWLPALPVFQILLIFSVSKGMVSICAPVFFLKGKPWLITLAAAVMVAAFGALCVPLTLAYQTAGTAWAVVLSGVASHALSFVLAFRLLSSPPPRS